MKLFSVKTGKCSCLYGCDEGHIYGILVYILLWYKTFKGYLLKKGIVFNDCDPCVADRQRRN